MRTVSLKAIIRESLWAEHFPAPWNGSRRAIPLRLHVIASDRGWGKCNLQSNNRNKIALWWTCPFQRASDAHKGADFLFLSPQKTINMSKTNSRSTALFRAPQLSASRRSKTVARRHTIANKLGHHMGKVDPSTKNKPDERLLSNGLRREWH